MDAKLESFNAWHNYKTGQTDYLTESESPTRGTVDYASAYIPQHIHAQALFRLYIQHQGLTVGQAMIKVLSLCAGVKE